MLRLYYSTSKKPRTALRRAAAPLLQHLQKTSDGARAACCASTPAPPKNLGRRSSGMLRLYSSTSKKPRTALRRAAAPLLQHLQKTSDGAPAGRCASTPA